MESVILKPQYKIPQGIMGQPTCYTHPHMVEEGYLTCCIKQEEYVDRRDTLMTKLSQECDQNANHIVVIPGAVKQYMSDKIPYVFRQNSDFFYLTGCLEPGAILVMTKEAYKDTYNTTLFVNEKDAHCFNQFLLTQMKSSPGVLWYQLKDEANKELTPVITTTVQQQLQGTMSWGDPQRYIQNMRLIKSPAEIELMKETCYIGAQAVNMAMACTKPGITEACVSAVLDFTSRQAGAEQLAFPPVVAGGPRAVHIHYVTNDQVLNEGENLLVDAGCQRWLYNSDISRTWPVSGTFSPYHKILYELVLTVQKRLIEILGDTRPPLDQLFDQMCRLLGKYLQQEGVLPKDIEGQELASRAYRLCPHHVSHYLGLDVHDSSLVKRNSPVEPGMVVTVEPGLYIKPDDTTVPPEFRGVGIRIEDDVLITNSKPLVLTDSCAKEVHDVEAIVGKHSKTCD
ncbi:metallopeptidase family m24 domain-containing protein [Phthorimaea operculella]|nr:metallopeptidase family m24 domain-containing protein [Phthorimaea operculella]